MASETGICNLALLKFGNRSIASMNEESTEAKACKVLYPLLRDEMIAAHPWNFAMRRADISAQLAAAPEFQYDYAYTLPPKCLRVWELYGVDVEWVIEGKELLTDQEEEIYIRYLEQITQAGYFPPAFVNCLALRLGAELATKLSSDKNRRVELLKELIDVALPEARHLNAIEGNKPTNKGAREVADDQFSWVTEGH